MRKYIAGPDGGWGWMVCLGTFMVAFVIEGTTAAFGVIIIPIQLEFEASKSSTTWVASLSFGVCYLIGPIVGTLLDRYSLRQVSLVGTIIGFLGFTASVFSPNIAVLIISYGIFGGISMGVTFMCAVVAVGRYFEKRRAVATGLAMSGAGFGMFAYPYFTEMMLHVYGWRGTVLIMAALYLNCAVSCAMFRPLPFLNDTQNTTLNIEDVIVPETTSNGLSILSQKLCSSVKLSDLSYDAEKPSQSLDDSARLLERTHKTAIPPKTPTMRRILTGNIHRSLPQINSPLLLIDGNEGKTQSIECIKQKRSHEFLPNGLSRRDIYSSGLMQVSCEQIYNGSVLNQDTKTRKDVGTCWDRFTSSDNVKLLKEPRFILTLFTMVFWSVQYIGTLYIPDFASSHGIPRHLSALLVSFIGVANTLGRVASGFIVDFLHIRSITLYFIAFLVVTIGTFFLPFCVTFWQIAIYSIVSGFCVGIFVGVRTIVIVDFVGIEYLAYAFGWVSFFQGVSSIPAPPIAGFLYDSSRSYQYTFIMVAVYYLCGSFTSLILRLSHRCSRLNRTRLIKETEICNS